MIDAEAYRRSFERFVLTRLSELYEALRPFYKARGASDDSLSYFRGHFPRFEAMIDLATTNKINVDGLKTVCELGSWYPYTSYYFKSQNPDVTIDLYDIILRELEGDVRPFDVDGVRLVDFNLCVDTFPDVSYDLVVLSEVMEHLPINLFRFQEKVGALLEPGGHLLVSYPLGGKNARDYDVDYGDRDWTRSQEDHIREFTTRTVRLFFTNLERVAESDVSYPAYGSVRLCLYRR